MQRDWQHHIFYTLMMQTDRGPRFLDHDLITLLPYAIDGRRYSRYTDALAAANSIEDTDYYVEVVEVNVKAAFSLPYFLKRRTA